MLYNSLVIEIRAGSVKFSFIISTTYRKIIISTKSRAENIIVIIVPGNRSSGSKRRS